MTALSWTLTLIFLFAGSVKLLGVQALKEQFIEFGLPVKMMILVGALEILGAIGLRFPLLAPWAVLGLGLLMAGAVVQHLKAKHPFSKTAPSLVLLILCLVLGSQHLSIG